jgi:hypothetical protein
MKGLINGMAQGELVEVHVFALGGTSIQQLLLG